MENAFTVVIHGIAKVNGSQLVDVLDAIHEPNGILI
jgi:hypothetical protein